LHHTVCGKLDLGIMIPVFRGFGGLLQVVNFWGILGQIKALILVLTDLWTSLVVWSGTGLL